MIPLDVLVAFFAASGLLCLAPGPDNIFVLTQSARRGRRAGLAVMFGLCTGLVGHSTAVALGIAVVFQTSAMAFSMLKFVGAGYLVYLAWQAFRASATPIAASDGENRLLKYYTRGIIMNITNPKVSIFFLAFLPQFADPARGPLAPQIFVLGLIFIVIALLSDALYALLAGQLGAWLKRSRHFETRQKYFSGMIYIALGVAAAISGGRSQA